MDHLFGNEFVDDALGWGEGLDATRLDLISLDLDELDRLHR